MKITTEQFAKSMLAARKHALEQPLLHALSVVGTDALLDTWLSIVKRDMADLSNGRVSELAVVGNVNPLLVLIEILRIERDAAVESLRFMRDDWGPFSARKCQLCVYVDGKLQRQCAIHEFYKELRAVDAAETKLEIDAAKDVLRSAHQGLTEILERGWTGGLELRAVLKRIETLLVGMGPTADEPVSIAKGEPPF